MESPPEYFNDVPMSVPDDRVLDQRAYEIESGKLPATEFLNIREMIENEPPPRKYLFSEAEDGDIGFMPEGEACGLAAAGGCGKSLLELQRVVSMSTGSIPFLNFAPNDGPRHCFIYTAEDSDEELWRRVYWIVRRMTEDLPQFEVRLAIEAMSEHLHVTSLLNNPKFMLTKLGDRESGINYDEGPAVDRILEDVEIFGGSGYVSLDPLRNITVGDEMGEAMTAVVKALNRLRTYSLGVLTPNLLTHTPKAAGKEGDLDMSIFRGAGDLVFGMRHAMTMAMVTKEIAQTLLIDGNPVSEAMRPDLRRWAAPKSNYERMREPSVIKYDRGIFMPVDCASADQKKIDKQRNAVGDLIKVLTREGPLSENALRTFAGVGNGEVSIAKGSLRGLLEMAEKDGYIERTKRSGKGAAATQKYKATGKEYLTEEQQKERDRAAYLTASGR